MSRILISKKGFHFTSLTNVVKSVYYEIKDRGCNRTASIDYNGNTIDVEEVEMSFFNGINSVYIVRGNVKFEYGEDEIDKIKSLVQEWADYNIGEAVHLIREQLERQVNNL